MTEDIIAWARIDEPRWQILQDKMRCLIETERTPARVMMALFDDTNIEMREAIVLTYWLGVRNTVLGTPTPAKTLRRVLRSCIN